MTPVRTSRDSQKYTVVIHVTAPSRDRAERIAARMENVAVSNGGTDPMVEVIEQGAPKLPGRAVR